MEAPRNRRKAITYGKSKKKVHIDSIFDDQIVSKPHIPTRLNLLDQIPPGILTTKKRNHNVVEIQAHEVSSHAGGQTSPLVSPYPRDNNQDSSYSSSAHSSHRGSANSSILDLLDSDEDGYAEQLQPLNVKRRRITPLSRQSVPEELSRSRKSKSATSTLGRGRQKTEAVSLSQREFLNKQHDGTAKRHGPATTGRERSETDSAAKSSQMKIQGNRLKSPKEQGSLPVPSPKQKGIVLPLQDPSEATAKYADPHTPRARRTLQNINKPSRPVASPSQLGLTSLRLTPDRKGSPILFTSKKLSPITRRVRHRLLEELDAPEEASRPDLSSPGVDVEEISVLEGASTGNNALAGRAPAFAHVTSVQAPTSPKISSTADDKPTITYAKERSHLSDMVDEINDIKPSRTSKLKPVMPASPFSRLTSETNNVDDADDNNDVSAAAAVKSIHELRQAGIVNRFERDMETLFEDIETSSTLSKALRAQALLRFLHKIQDTNIATQFVEAGMIYRLAQASQISTDTISAVLFTLALSEVLALDRGSPEHLLAAFQALVRLAPSTLTYGQPFTEIIVDRKQNLSKALIRDLMTLSRSTKFGNLRDASFWTPQHIALSSLEESLQTMRRSKIVPPHLPTSVFNLILDLLSTALEPIEGREKSRQIMVSALTILDYSAVSPGAHCYDDVSDTHLNYRIFADVMTCLMHHSSSEPRDVKSIGLRLVVSLTNNEPAICTTLAETDLIPAIFSVIEQELPTLIDNADSGDEFDDSKLDAVIMALGCLLNLTDCSSIARGRLYMPYGANPSCIHWLISVFNKRAGKAEEATTIAQSQVLVAFGYLSMLLCTLCLDDEIYDYITDSVAGGDLTALIREAQEFLDKLETVANLNPDDPATSTFTARFRSILLSLTARTRLRNFTLSTSPTSLHVE